VERGLDKRQDAAPATVTVVQTVTVGGADGGIAGNNTVTVTVTAQAAGGAGLASTVTVTNCLPGQAQGAASSVDLGTGASVSPPVAGAVGAAPVAASPVALGVPSGGIGVVVVSIPDAVRTQTRGGSGPAPSASAQPPAATAPVVQNPAAPGKSSFFLCKPRILC